MTYACIFVLFFVRWPFPTPRKAELISTVEGLVDRPWAQEVFPLDHQEFNAYHCCDYIIIFLTLNVQQRIFSKIVFLISFFFLVKNHLFRRDHLFAFQRAMPPALGNEGFGVEDLTRTKVKRFYPQKASLSNVSEIVRRFRGKLAGRPGSSVGNLVTF